MKNLKACFGLSSIYALLLTCQPAEVRAANLLLNPGFDTLVSPADWTIPSAAAQKSTYVHTPGGLALRFDLWGVPSGGASSAYQKLPTQGGQEWTFSGWVLNPSQFQLIPDGSSYAMLEMVFTGSGPDTIFQSTHMNDLNLPPDAWTSLTTTGVAPAGSSEVTFKITFVRPGTETGPMIYWDDMAAEVSPVPEPYVGLIAAGVPLLAILLINVRRKRSRLRMLHTCFGRSRRPPKASP